MHELPFPRAQCSKRPRVIVANSHPPGPWGRTQLEPPRPLGLLLEHPRRGRTFVLAAQARACCSQRLCMELHACKSGPSSAQLRDCQAQIQGMRVTTGGRLRMWRLGPPCAASRGQPSWLQEQPTVRGATAKGLKVSRSAKSAIPPRSSPSPRLTKHSGSSIFSPWNELNIAGVEYAMCTLAFCMYRRWAAGTSVMLLAMGLVQALVARMVNWPVWAPAP